MRKLLFSSIALLFLCGASCNGQQGRVEQQSEAEASTSEKHLAPPEDSAKAERLSSGGMPSTEESPEHRTPDQQKLDSVKASFPVKK